MFGFSFSNPGISCASTSPSRPIAQIRSVVLSPAFAAEHAAVTIAPSTATARRTRWLMLCRERIRFTIELLKEACMRLNRLSILLAAVVLGCSHATEPTHVDGVYNLNDIDGRKLPTPPAFTPGLTPTVLS